MTIIRASPFFNYMASFVIFLFVVIFCDSSFPGAFVSSVQAEKEILFAGDSDIERWKKTNTIYPNSINKGDSGSTCRQWKNRIGKTVDKYDPTTVVLVCGENDLSNRNPGTVFADFQKVVTNIYAKGADRVIYMGTKPEPDTECLHKDYRTYDSLIRDFYGEKDQQQKGKFVMVDVYPSFEALDNPRNFYSNDELHLSQKGYDLWNTWLKSALADSNCIRWKDGDCVLRNNEDDNNDSLTDSPTSSSTPSPSPSSSCSDDPDFRHNGKKNFDCNWVGDKPGKRCGKKYKGERLWLSCPQSCGDC